MQKKEPTEEETLRAGGISEDGTAAMVGDWQVMRKCMGAEVGIENYHKLGNGKAEA